MLDEHCELHTSYVHDQTLMNLSHEFPPPPQATMPVQNISQIYYS